MAAIKLGVDVEPTQAYLNQLSRATVTRIRRCTLIKQAALEKLHSDDLKERKRGFAHLIIALHFQKRSFSRYIKFLEQFQATAELAGQDIASSQPLQTGFFGSLSYSSAKNDLIGSFRLTEEIFLSIKTKSISLQEIIEAQFVLTKINFDIDKPSLKRADVEKMASAIKIDGDDEARLRSLISFEIRESEKLISNLNKCMEISDRILKSAHILQRRFIKFLDDIRKGKLPDFLRDPDALCDKIKEQMPVFYALKTVIVLLGVPIALFVPIQAISFVGKIAAGGFIGADQAGDSVASIPAFKKIINKINRTVDVEEEKQRKITVEIIAGLKEMPSEMVVS